MSDQNPAQHAPVPDPVQPTAPPSPTPQQVTPADADPTSPSQTGSVNLARLLSDNFGMAEVNARDTILTAREILLDGQPYTGDKEFIPYDMLVGKEITVSGPYRSVKLTYNP